MAPSWELSEQFLRSLYLKNTRLKRDEGCIHMTPIPDFDSNMNVIIGKGCSKGGVTTSSLHRDSESYRIELKISGKLLYREISRLEVFLDDFGN